MLRLTQITKDYKTASETVHALRGIDLSFRKNEFVSILGPSGCGKTTTLRIIGGFVSPDSGDVEFSGQRINDVPAYKRHVNTVFQRYALFPHLNVFENVAFGLRIPKTDENGKIVKAAGPSITAQCFRVACQDGHMAACFVKFNEGCKPSIEQIKADWNNFAGRAQELNLPSAPKQFLHYYEEENRPQTKLDRMTEKGMAVNIGRLREDTQYDYKFVCLSHNTLRGAAGGAVLLAELLCAEGYILPR